MQMRVSVLQQDHNTVGESEPANNSNNKNHDDNIGNNKIAYQLKMSSSVPQ